MSKELTAVEWLVDELLSGKLLMPSLIEQAKEKEKQQIIISQIKALQTDFFVKYESSEQYYNETYKL